MCLSSAHSFVRVYNSGVGKNCSLAGYDQMKLPPMFISEGLTSTMGCKFYICHNDTNFHNSHVKCLFFYILPPLTPNLLPLG